MENTEDLKKENFKSILLENITTHLMLVFLILYTCSVFYKYLLSIFLSFISFIRFQQITLKFNIIDIVHFVLLVCLWKFYLFGKERNILDISSLKIAKVVVFVISLFLGLGSFLLLIFMLVLVVYVKTYEVLFFFFKILNNIIVLFSLLKISNFLEDLIKTYFIGVYKQFNIKTLRKWLYFAIATFIISGIGLLFLNWDEVLYKLMDYQYVYYIFRFYNFNKVINLFDSFIAAATLFTLAKFLKKLDNEFISLN